MFQKGEYVVYGSNGVCRIEEIKTLDFKGIPKDLEYYVLTPVYKGGTIYVPVEKGREGMRYVITQEEAGELIAGLSDIEPIAIKDEKMLEEMYRKCLYGYDARQWIRLIKYIYSRRQQRKADGKKLTATDDKYMHLAEDALYSELGLALGIPQNEVPEYIAKTIKK